MTINAAPYKDVSAAYERHDLTHPGAEPPFRAWGYNVIVVSAVIEAGIIRCIGYGDPTRAMVPFVNAVLDAVGRPGLCVETPRAEWTAYTYRIPHYVMDALGESPMPRGVYLYRRKLGSTYTNGWSFEFDRQGEKLADLPRGW